MFPYLAVSITEMRFTFLYGYDKMYKQNLFSIQKGRCFMKIKKNMCAALSGTMLFMSAYTPVANAWSIYDSDYGMEWNEQSKTAVTDDMEEYRQNDSLESLVYTIRDDGSAMITSYSAKFWHDPVGDRRSHGYGDRRRSTS